MKIEIFGKHDFITSDQIKTVVGEFETHFPETATDKILEIEFVDAEKMQDINYQHRNINKSTDVLSFPQAEIPGENQVFGTIIICKSEADNRHENITELIKHGLLHLNGLDHETNLDTWLKSANKINHNMG